MSHTDFRLPAEWERQSATLLAWPHANSDWAGSLDAIQREYVELIGAILRHQQVVLLTMPGDDSARSRLGDHAGLHYVEIRFNDTWCRDYGPVTLVHAGERLALDFYFNGWGGKHPAALDNRVNTLLARHELFRPFDFRQYLFELEGGAIESDGHGFLLVNWHCLEARHPHLSRREIDHELHTLLNVDKVIGIDMEPMPGDDTDGHIDTLARFISPEMIVFQEQADADRTGRLRGQLESLRTAAERSFDLYSLPVADDVDPDLPASYANFVLINDACLVPAYDSDSDERARGVLADLLPERDVLLVPARTIIRQFGSLHCATMHIPASLG